MSVTEAAVVRAIVRELDTRGIVSWNTNGSAGETGLPDRMAVLPGGRLLCIEAKRPKGGRVSPKQQWWLDRLAGAGALTIVCRDVRELRELWDLLDAEKMLASALRREEPHA